MDLEYAHISETTLAEELEQKLFLSDLARKLY